MGKNVFYLFYKITRRKLKRGNSLHILHDILHMR